MAYIEFSTSTRTGRANAIVTAAGSTPFLQIWTGSYPATPDTAATGTLLVALAIGTVLGTVSNGTLTLTSISTVNATVTGTAGYARITTTAAATTSVVDLDVGTVGASVIINTTSITSGGPVAVASGTIVES